MVDKNLHESSEYWEENSLRYRGLNPLLIPDIIRSIFQEFTYAELKELRLVCRAWEYEASIILRTSTQVRFPASSDLEEYLSQLACNYCCESYELNSNIPLDSPSAQTFFERFGSDITFLKLHQITWTGEQLWDLLAKYLQNLQELSIRLLIPFTNHGHFKPMNPPTILSKNTSLHLNLPKLRWLKLNFTIEKQLKSSPPPPPEITHPKILYELFQAFPDIEELTSPNWPVLIPPKTNVSTIVFNTIINPQTPELQLSNLTKIHINSNLDDMQIFQLMEKHFPLQELRLDIDPEMKGYALFFLLQSLEKTLQKLILTFRCGGYEDRDFDDFPTLKNLKYLALHQYIGPIDFVLHHLPNLKTLLLNDIILGSSLSKNYRQHKNLEELIFEGRNYNALAQLYILSKMFPHLKKLRAENADDTMLRVIFIKLPFLEVLHADGKFSDEGVTGIPADVAQNIFEVEDVESVRIYPYIGNLKHLRKLVLTSNLLTYLAILLGVNDCKSLTVKQVRSDKILQSLTNKMTSAEQEALLNYKNGIVL